MESIDRGDLVMSWLLGGEPGGEQPLDVLREDVDLEVDAVAGRLGAERGQRERWDERIEKASSATSTTVRLTPLTVIEPFSTR